jgi:hypothetical protein
MRDEPNRIRRMVLVRMTAAGVTPLGHTISIGHPRTRR